MKTKKIAIIPARGGSKRIKNKNIANFCGRPMISYCLEAARESNIFDEIHVSTDSVEIVAIVEKLGFKVHFLRDQNLADDHTPIRPVLQWVLKEFQNQGTWYDDCCLLMPTAPMIEASDLVEGWKVYEANGREKFCLAVAPYECPIEWAMSRDDQGMLTPEYPGMFKVRSQDLGQKYFDTGTFIIYNSEILCSPYPPEGDTNFVGHVISREKAVDIDTPEDWKLAEALFEAKKLLSQGRA